MSYTTRPIEPNWRRRIVALEIGIVMFWGGAILVIANALSGPFSTGRWITMAAIWLMLPLLITGAFVLTGNYLIRAGRRSAGMKVLSVPLVVLGVLAIGMFLFG